MSEIEVHFGQLEGAAGQIGSLSTQLQGVLDDVKSRVAATVAQWQGSASEAYQSRQHEWDTTAADMQAILVQIGQTTANSNQDYLSTEHSNAASWQ
jgi:WXG100 family type VII secretion target